MFFRFTLAETGRKVPWRYVSAPHLDTDLFEITPGSPIVRFMFKPCDVEFWPIPDNIPGRNIYVDFYEGELPEGVEMVPGIYPIQPATLQGTPVEGGKWSFTIEASVE